MPAYIWTNDAILSDKLNEMCLNSVKSGYVEPVDAVHVAKEGTTETLLD